MLIRQQLYRKQLKRRFSDFLSVAYQLIQITGSQIIELYSRGITVRGLADPRHWLGAPPLPSLPLPPEPESCAPAAADVEPAPQNVVSCSAHVSGSACVIGAVWRPKTYLAACVFDAAPPRVGMPGEGVPAAAGPIGSMFESFGAVKAGAFTAARLLREREAVLLFPGGGREARICRWTQFSNRILRSWNTSFSGFSMKQSNTRP